MNDNVTLVHRHISTSVLRDPDTCYEAVQILAALSQTRDVQLNLPRKRITVSYDVMQMSYAGLLRALDREGLIKLGEWQRLRRLWINSQDSNLRDNVASRASPCCNTSPDARKRWPRMKG